MTGSTYSGISMFLSRIMSAMSLPHTDVWSEPVGTITLETATKSLFIVMFVSVVTKTWLAG